MAKAFSSPGSGGGDRSWPRHESPALLAVEFLWREELGALAGCVPVRWGSAEGLWVISHDSANST